MPHIAAVPTPTAVLLVGALMQLVLRQSGDTCAARHYRSRGPAGGSVKTPTPILPTRAARKAQARRSWSLSWEEPLSLKMSVVDAPWGFPEQVEIGGANSALKVSAGGAPGGCPEPMGVVTADSALKVRWQTRLDGAHRQGTVVFSVDDLGTKRWKTKRIWRRRVFVSMVFRGWRG